MPIYSNYRKTFGVTGIKINIIKTLINVRRKITKYLTLIFALNILQRASRCITT